MYLSDGFQVFFASVATLALCWQSTNESTNERLHPFIHINTRVKLRILVLTVIMHGSQYLEETVTVGRWEEKKARENCRSEDN